MQTEARIEGLGVRKYKNLRDLWLPWGEGLAIFGTNGVGKTNLLECMALLLGNQLTLSLAGPRLEIPGEDDLCLVATSLDDALPWPPDFLLPHSFNNEKTGHESYVSPAINRAILNKAWWSHLGSDSGGTFVDAFARIGLPDPITQFVLEIARTPTIRYNLATMSISPETTSPRRTFATTLVTDKIPKRVRKLIRDLPEPIRERFPSPLSPLISHLMSQVVPRQSAASSRDPWIDILELPPVDRPPASLQWLARARTEEELFQNMRESFLEASSPTRELSDQIAALDDGGPAESDWHWWLHKRGERAGNEELELTMPKASVTAAGGDHADYVLAIEDATISLELHTGDKGVLNQFSSGQRRWVDEAMATISRDLDRFADTARLQSSLIAALHEDIAREATRAFLAEAQTSAEEGDYWLADDFDRRMALLEPRLLAAQQAELHRFDMDSVKREVWLETNPHLRLLLPQIVVRVFDEPEAHLHPALQRRLARALDHLRGRGENIIIASHSPHFLDLPNWSLIHLHRDDEGNVRAAPLEAADIEAQKKIASRLGVNRGELLAGINLLLLVEGEHDRLFLDILYGDELREAGIAILPMRGTTNLLAETELEFVKRYLDVPITILIDNTSVDRVADHKPRTTEEEKLVDLVRARSAEGFQLVGLDRPDIVAYLAESDIASDVPSFPGWATVIASFERLTARASQVVSEERRRSFKPWLKEAYGLDLRTSSKIRSRLERMKVQRLQPEGDLHRKVHEILAAADESLSVEAD